MIEAEITCECLAIGLPDLGLSLTKGMVVYIDADKARKSPDLQRAWKALGVSVKYVQRFRERRPELPASPPTPPASLPPAFIAAAAPEIPYHPDPPVLDVDALALQVVALLVPRLQVMVDAAFAGLQIVGGVPAKPPSGVAGKVVVGEDVPVFIPSKIGRDDLRPSVEVEATEGEAGGVTDAVAALKAARRSEKP